MEQNSLIMILPLKPDSPVSLNQADAEEDVVVEEDVVEAAVGEVIEVQEAEVLLPMMMIMPTTLLVVVVVVVAEDAVVAVALLEVVVAEVMVVLQKEEVTVGIVLMKVEGGTSEKTTVSTMINMMTTVTKRTMMRVTVAGIKMVAEKPTRELTILRHDLAMRPVVVGVLVALIEVMTEATMIAVM